jgi:hypothetical protein
MSIEDHVFYDSDVTGASVQSKILLDVKIDIEKLDGFEYIEISEKDVEAMAIHFKLIKG